MEVHTDQETYLQWESSDIGTTASMWYCVMKCIQYSPIHSGGS